MRKERASVARSLTITELPPTTGIATIMSRKGIAREAIGAAIGIQPPEGPSRVQGEQLALIGNGPGTWLALAEAPQPTWPSQLAEQLVGLASVSDQSGSYTIFRIGGNDARRLLQAGAFIDLHPDVFRPGSVVTTVIAHIGVILWQLDDAPTFDIATFRSYAHSFRRWLDVTAATL
jgi:heterotetrameric sarcosine oxidase gamma subunit